jgi:hypothetical protein
MLINRDRGVILQKFAKLKLKFVIKVIIGVSALLNIGHVFQYSLNDGVANYASNLVSVYYFTLYTLYPSIEKYSETLDIYLLVYFLINYVVFFAVNTGVEVLLVRRLRAELANKKQRLEDMQMTTVRSDSIGVNSTPLVVSFRRMRKQEIEAKTEQRAIIMVVVNATLNFSLRLPELLFLFSLKLIRSKALFSVLDTFPFLKFFWTDLTFFFYILALSTNFLVYFLFNQKFKRTFSKRAAAAVRVNLNTKSTAASSVR